MTYKKSIYSVYLFFGAMLLMQGVYGTGVPPPALEIDKDGVSFKDGIKLKGVNWFGFNNQQTMVDGLWIGGFAAATDFSTIMLRIKLLGFNTIRLPFTFSNLDLPTTSKTIPCIVQPLPEVVHSVFNRYYPVPRVFSPLPKNNVCNDYLPNGKTLDRFLWTINEFVRNGFYVVLDYHPMSTENHPFSVKKFVDAWDTLWTRITRMPNFNTQLKGRVILDIMNEPDSMNIGWQSYGNIPGAKDLYLGTMDRLYKKGNPLFMIEGTGQTGYKLSWGNGFVVNSTLIETYGLSDPRKFFNELLTKPYVNNVIISPHLYGPTISKDNEFYRGRALWDRLNNSFGHLYQHGYCLRGKCKKFMVVLGEFGSFFTDQRDIDYYNDMAAWFTKHMGGNKNWIFWCYNENSGDTGGIVKKNWYDLEWKKLEWLKKDMDLKYIYPRNQ
jgi:hypothetical protein